MRASSVFSFGAALVLVLSRCFTPGSLPSFTVCTFRSWTGMPCPGCGMTRAFCALAHGEWRAAWDFHPFSYAFFAFTIAAALWPLAELLAPRASAKLDARWLFAFAFSTSLGVVVFGTWRLWRALHGAVEPW